MPLSMFSPLFRFAGAFLFAGVMATVFFITPLSAHAATASVTATPSELFTGGEITVTWSSSGAFKCVGSGFSTGDKTSGTAKVTATGSGTKTFSVSCYDDSPKCSLSLEKSFTDDAPGRNTCSGSNATVFYSPSGSCYPKYARCQASSGRYPNYTKSFYQCLGSCSIASKSASVVVKNPPPPPNPTVKLSLSPSVVKEGNSVLLSWEATRATTCRGTGFSTGGSIKDSVSVTPSGNTTYSITCDSEVHSSTPGTWRYVGQDITDLWCTSRPGYSNFYTNNQCSSSNPEGQSCTGSDLCAVNNWQTKGGGPSGNQQYCNLVSDLYRCDGGSAPNQVTDSVTVTYNRAPNAPTITGPIMGTAGRSYSFSFRATDPDGDQVRYRIDWDNNGTVDQVLPSAGYVPSNTLRSASRSWPAPGTYTFRALTQDNNGAQSEWRSHTITVSSTGPACSDGIDNDGDGLIDYPSDPGCSSGIAGTEAPQCNDGIDNDGDGLIDAADYGCSAESDGSEAPNPQCSDGIDNNGNGKIDYPADPACSSSRDGNEEALPSASITLEADPALAPENASASLVWSAANVEENSCTLSGTNGDSWNLSGASGTKTTSPLVEETIFTLSCTDLNEDPVATSVTVKLLPSFEEI